VALQTKTPLSLLFSWLGRIESVLPEDRQELMDKITRQLKKIELTTDRLALFESGKGIIPYNEARFDFSDVIHAIKKDFPKSEIDRINFKNDHTPSFKGDRFQIKFCVETILSYLLRYLPGDRKIDVMITHNTEWIQCRIKGVLPGSGEDGIAEEKAAMRQTLDDMALGEPIIDQFIRKNHKGKYIRPKGRTGQFRIDLPTRKTGHE
jgi:hypothetical protein